MVRLRVLYKAWGRAKSSVSVRFRAWTRFRVAAKSCAMLCVVLGLRLG